MPHDPSENPHSDPEQDFRPEHFTPPIAPIQTGGPLRRVLPWALSAAAVLGLMLLMLFLVLPRLSQVPRRSRSLPLPSGSATALPPRADPDLPALSQPPAAGAPAASLPLIVTLYSANGGKHVPVGKPVLISAYAALPSAGSATIAISYTRNGGPRSLLTLAQGSLSTASWTPAQPGRYDFTASALDSRKISAFSRHITIDADAPPKPVRLLPPRTVPPALPAKLAMSVPARRAIPLAHRRIAARIVPLKRPAPKHSTLERPAPRHQVQASPSKAYHVVAATFIVAPIAETLAGALRRRGFHAFVRVLKQPHHKLVYAVETGAYPRSADAQKQAETLRRDGYPASVSR